MSVSQPQVYCPNLNCSAPLNSLGDVVCENCQTPLIYRYLWAVGETVLTVPIHTMVAGRYYVKAPQVWLDTQPALQPDFPTELTEEIQAYLYLSPHRLHVPDVYGICPIAVTETEPTSMVTLLENVPLDDKGNLCPAIAHCWASATAVRQVYWLWQLLALWEPLAAEGACASVLIADNIRVEGWRVRLCQLFWDEGILATPEAEANSVPALSLADLAMLWLGWVDQSQPTVSDALRDLCYEMRVDNAEVGAIAAQLNQLLLQQAAQLPLQLQVASKTDTGPHHDNNEDTCFPTVEGLREEDKLPQLMMVCDGIGGHEGGEIASQLAVQSLKLQTQALLTEIVEQPEPQPLAVVGEQLEAIVRVANDLISAQNDAQGREARRRMGTTLVMGLQLPQRVHLPDGAIADNSHELYLVNVGDSRAYWITPRYCHCLTLDDDVATREVRMGRLLYREALQRSDAGSLIQALGTRDSDYLHPTLQRLILEEDGVLLLCSDGLSDNNLVKQGWMEIMSDVFRGKKTLDAAAADWIKLANQKNGHDNVTVVMLRCHVSSPTPQILLPSMSQDPSSEWTETSKALLEENSATPVPVNQTEKPRSPKLLWIGLAIALLLVGGFAIWSRLQPGGNQQNREQVPPNP